MIEMPESIVIARQLNETVKGKKIVRVQAAHTPHSFAWYEGEPSKYSDIMEGKSIGAATGIGSMIEIELDDESNEDKYSFIVGDGANIRYYEPGSKVPERYQTGIMLEDGSFLICTVQMYGAMFLVQPKTYNNSYYLVAKEKPFPGTEEFDYAYFSSLREQLSGKISVKEFLATHQRIPGLGNGVLQDILLKSGLHPKHKIGTLQETDWMHMYEAVVSVLDEMTLLGGRNTEKTLFGEAGGYQTMLSKKTIGKPCVYCGNIIQKANYLGGTIYFCPECQM